MESGKSRSVMANNHIRSAAYNMVGQRHTRDLAELRPWAYQRHFVRRGSDMGLCHERVLTGKASCLGFIVPVVATGRRPTRTERVRAVVVLRICVVIRTDVRR